MPYSEQDLDEIPHDCARLRAYVWRVAMNAKLMVPEHRRASRATAVAHPVTNYRAEHHNTKPLNFLNTCRRFPSVSEIA
jgi:hypothetical protein